MVGLRRDAAKRPRGGMVVSEKLETRYAEFRAEAEGRRLLGTLIKYGDVAMIPGGIKERFMPGAFGDVAALDVILNGHHDRARPLARTGGAGLVLEDSADALTMTATLPSTRDADDTLELVRTHVLRGLSIEFKALSEHMEAGPTRIIDRARLGAVAIVDKPAYSQSSVEARARRKKRRTWVRGGIKYGVKAHCECVPGSCDSVLFRPEALEPADDVLAFIGRTSESVGSVAGETLVFTKSGDALLWELTDAARDTAAGSVLDDLAKAGVAVYGRPLIDAAASTFTELDSVRIFDLATFYGLLLKPIAQEEVRQGWDPIVFAGAVAAGVSRRRLYLWL